MLGFNTHEMPYTETKTFRIVALTMGDIPVYGIYNKLTGHVEMMFSQFSQAILNMQTMQQTFDRVLTGETNGYFAPGNLPQFRQEEL